MLSNETLDAGEKLGVCDDPVFHEADPNRKYPTEQAGKSETSCFVTDSIECDTSDAMAQGELRGRALYERLLTFKPAGLDEYQWAIRIGLNRGYFNDIKEKNTSPRSDTLNKIMSSVGKTVADLYQSEISSQPALVKAPFNPSELPRDVPILGTATGAMLEVQTNGAVERIEEIELQEEIGFARRPVSLANNRKAYALYVAGDSMYPRYAGGELVYVDPRRQPMIGDDVIVQLVGDIREDADPAEIKHVLVKRLVRNTASHLELEQFNPAITFKLAKANIASVHRVVPYTELLT